MISQTSIATFHFLDEHLNEIDPSEIVILENLGTQLNKKVKKIDSKEFFSIVCSFVLVFSQ